MRNTREDGSDWGTVILSMGNLKTGEEERVNTVTGLGEGDLRGSGDKGENLD